jgi:hypothetical protein
MGQRPKISVEKQVEDVIGAAKECYSEKQIK